MFIGVWGDVKMHTPFRSLETVEGGILSTNIEKSGLSHYPMVLGWFVVFILTLSACGIDEGGPSTGSTSWYSIIIDTPTAESTYSTDCNELWIGGTTDYPPSQWSNVLVGWQNQTSGGLKLGVGQTSVYQCWDWILGYYDCNPVWWAKIPLELGDNSITITAEDSNGVALEPDTIAVGKPEMSYSIKGRITNVDGTELFNMKVLLEGASNFDFTDVSGYYELNCLRSGTHTLRPDPMGFYYPAYMFYNYMDWPFNPASRTVAVSEFNVEGQDFSTEVYEISGIITTVYGEGFQNLDVFIMESGYSTASARTDSSGTYTLLAPNGTYIVQPSNYFSFTPAFRSVNVNGSGVYDQNFSAQ